jgi:hypothetical protein
MLVMVQIVGLPPVSTGGYEDESFYVAAPVTAWLFDVSATALTLPADC